MTIFSLFFAFSAGLVSFLSPCVLPIIPGFLAYLAGTTVADAAAKRKEVFINACFFVLGFSSIFSALGILLNTVLAASAYGVQLWLSRIGGLLVITFGFYLIGLIRIPWLDREYKMTIKRKFSSRYLTSFLFGAAFAAGWTPCVGAVLGGILGLAASAPGSAFILLLSYSLGLGLPFLLVGLFTAPASKFLNKIAGSAKYVNMVFGVLLVALGVLVFTQSLNLVANFDFVNNLLLR